MRIPFQDWEKDFIILVYPTTSTKIIAEYLHRSKSVIRQHAYQHNIKKPVKVKIDDIFGKLKIIELSKIDKRRGRIWKCLCACGNITYCDTSKLITNHSKSCGCERIVSISTGYKNISGVWYGNIKRNASKRKLCFNVSLEYLQNIWEQQKGLCALSKLPIHIPVGIYNSKLTTASLDRINNNLGYIEGNVQFLHKHINYMKWTHRQDYFIQLCKYIAERN